MPTSTAYSLTYANIPFCGDRAHIVRLGTSPEENALTANHRPEDDLFSEINRLIPFDWLRDYVPCPPPSSRLAGLAANHEPTPPFVEVGQWYYPTGASRWSVFRGLMNSAMVAAVRLATSNYRNAAAFTMQAAPSDPTTRPTTSYSITTSMRCLPPRPLGENGGTFPGLYLVTLVDERWYFQGTAVTLHPTPTTTWADLIEDIGDVLGVTITYSTIGSEYSTPEPDSPLWCNGETASVLLDAIAANIGRSCVREYDGSFTLLTWEETKARIAANRGTYRSVVRMAGGDIFASGSLLPVGDQSSARNAVVPQSVSVLFPKYITGNDPVPHYFNPRTSGQQPTIWDEEGYGACFSVNVPIASGGVNVSGLTGVSQETLQTTAKALYSTEAGVTSDPTNLTDTTSLSLALAKDHYNSLVVPSLDEVYPGTYAWTPEGGHDLIFTYSERLRQASLRVVRSAWNSMPFSFQHSTPGVSYVAGAGGKRVPLTITDGVATQYGTNLIRLGTGLSLSVSGTNGGINEVLINSAATSGGVFTSGSTVDFTYVTLNYNNSTINYASGNTVNLFGGSLFNVYGSGQVNVYSGGILTIGLSGTLVLASGSTTNVNPGATFNFNSGSTVNLAGALFNFTQNNRWSISSGRNVIVSGGDRWSYYTPLEICGYQFWCCQPISTSGISAVTNWDLPLSGGAATIYTVMPDSPTTIAGIVPAYSGSPQLIGLVNVSSGKELRLLHDDAGTDTFNEILLPSAWSGSSMSLYDGDAAVLWWDECNAEKWRVLSTTAEKVGTGSFITVGSWVQTSGVTQTISDSTFTPINWSGGTLHYDYGGFFNSGQPTRMSVPLGKQGLYTLVGQASLPSSMATYTQFVALRRNGNFNVGRFGMPSNTSDPEGFLQATSTTYLNSGDYVELVVWQDAGAPLTCSDTGLAITFDGPVA